MKYVPLEPFLGKSISITLVRSVNRKRVTVHRGVLLRFTGEECCLQARWNKRRVVWISRPKEGLDSIELIEENPEEDR